MIFWIIAGLIGLGLYFLNQNRTEKKDRTTITHKKVIHTSDGEVHIERRQVIDSVRTSYTKKDVAQNEIKNITPLVDHNPVEEINNINQEDEIKELVLTPSPKPIFQEDIFSRLDHETKTCLKCNKNLHHSEFPQSNKNEDGLTKWCISCLNQLNEDRKNKLGNKKQCPNCKKNRLKTSFYKNSKQPDGLTKWCKDCMHKSKK